MTFSPIYDQVIEEHNFDPEQLGDYSLERIEAEIEIKQGEGKRMWMIPPQRQGS